MNTDDTPPMSAEPFQPTPEPPCPTCGGKCEIQSWDSGGSWWSDCPDCEPEGSP
jgi:hypothetical protein